MKYTILNNSDVSLTVNIDCDVNDVNLAFEKAAKKIGTGMNLPGFRAGKIPTSVIKKRFGQRVAADATELLADINLLAILKKENIQQLAPLQYHGMPAVEGQAFTYKAEVDVLPPITFPENSTILANIHSPNPTEDELNDMLDQALRRFAQYADVQGRLPDDGDFVLVDVHAMSDDGEVYGMSKENIFTRLTTSKENHSELESLIRTMSINETKHGTMICPDNYINPSLRGKEIKLTVKLKKIQTEILPPMNDSTAQLLGFKTFDDLKKEVWQQTFSQRLKSTQREAKHSALDTLCKNLDFTIPPRLIDKFYKEHQNDAKRYLTSFGADAQNIKTILDNLHSESLAYATDKAKKHTVLLAYAQKEHVSVTSEEAENEIKAMVRKSGQDFEAFKETIWENGMINDMRERLITDKALDRLFMLCSKRNSDAFELKPFKSA